MKNKNKKSIFVPKAIHYVIIDYEIYGCPYCENTLDICEEKNQKKIIECHHCHKKCELFPEFDEIWHRRY